MAINPFNVSYNDFKLGDIINPDEFDVNFSDIMIRFNQILDVLNQITDGVDKDGLPASGAALIDIDEVSPFLSPKLQGFLSELVTRLQSEDAGVSGAEFIGSSTIPGVIGNTVQSQLESLRDLFESLLATHEADTATANQRFLDAETRIGNTEADVVLFNQSVSNLDANKANKTDTYTKQQTDLAIQNAEGNIRVDHYDQGEMDVLLDEKTDAAGDHAGTWQGINVTDLASIIGATGVAISNTRPVAPSNGLMWFNPSNGEYELYLNGEWRINTKPTQIKKVHNRVVLGADVNTVAIGIPNFNPLYDAFMVMQNSVFIAENFEYTATDTYITATSGVWTAGTVFDFIAFIGSPVT